MIRYFFPYDNVTNMLVIVQKKTLSDKLKINLDQTLSLIDLGETADVKIRIDKRLETTGKN